ncbi:hypothetical protein EGR_04828 [Echinococcus granulosus]|uniref:Uncharacterized protein n=1 Tax=Echinococcus granulosus TaxID=6210 RepID=W6UFP4_ECHGR|nr:hypothetical protein EGR_04828 [Echinococcus granulosus]EUB60270.1 hypothetical protein EGR_04828 [Echinococcus granulosus]
MAFEVFQKGLESTKMAWRPDHPAKLQRHVATSVPEVCRLYLVAHASGQAHSLPDHLHEDSDCSLHKPPDALRANSKRSYGPADSAVTLARARVASLAK